MSYQVIVLVGLMFQRVWELGVSRYRLARNAETDEAEPIPEAHYPAMVLLHAGWFAGCWAEVLLLRPEFRAWVAIPMLVVWGLSLGLRIWMLQAMGDAWNVRVLRRAGQSVVTSGPYRFIRHPNYLAVILEITAVPLLLGAYWTALAATLANGVVLWLRIQTEEAYLFSVDAYREAFADKKRLIPRVF